MSLEPLFLIYYFSSLHPVVQPPAFTFHCFHFISTFSLYADFWNFFFVDLWRFRLPLLSKKVQNIFIDVLFFRKALAPVDHLLNQLIALRYTATQIMSAGKSYCVLLAEYF